MNIAEELYKELTNFVSNNRNIVENTCNILGFLAKNQE